MGDPERDILDLIESGRKLDAIKLAREYLGMGLAEARAFVEGLEGDVRGGMLETGPVSERAVVRPRRDRERH